MFRFISVTLVLVCAASVVAEGSGWSDKEKRENFQLYVSRCDPIGVEVYASVDEDVSLTREAIKTTVRSRLRAARLYGVKPKPVSGVLAISVTAAPWAYNYRVWFLKRQLDEMAKISSWSPTGWSRGGLVPNSQDPLDAVARSLDQFLDDFLRVNECTCDPVRQTEPKPGLGCPLPFDPFDSAKNRL